ncbi:MAG: indole-3-glycerol-phosphate synthase [Actinobacteria bacterium]|nr:indole-3-glycerol-phosphate synthase [Actinomycetota bacterium]
MSEGPTPNFLTVMVGAAHVRVAYGRRERPLRRPPSAEPGRLRDALQAAADGGHLALIAEVKRRSPSKGDIAPHLDAVTQARAYQNAGADAISVLTEPTRFGGSLDDLQAVAAGVTVPVLRKDFIVDPYQIWEATRAGADAVLLIAAILDAAALGVLLAECWECGLDALVEIHTRDELTRVIAARANLVGVNNRNLSTLDVDMHTTEEIGPAVPRGILFVSESGIASIDDARRAAAAGASALLVGEALVRCPHERLPDLVHQLRTVRRAS